MKRFALVHYGVNPRDRDLDQLAQLLRQLGHEALIISRSPRSGDGRTVFNGTPVILVPGKIGRWAHFFSIPLPFNFLWQRKLTELGKKHRIDAFIVRETPLSWMVLRAAEKLKIPAFLDMRENLTAMYETGHRKKWNRKLFRPTGLIRKFEAFVLPKYKYVFAVTEDLAAWLTEHYKVNPDNISILTNYPGHDYLRQAETAFNRKKIRPAGQGIKLIHAGFIMKNRGLQDIIRALHIVVSQNIPLSLRIIGEGKYADHIKQLVDDLKINEYVDFLPMLPPQELADALVEADIGVCSYLLNKQTQLTMPGKLFEYMAVGLPIFTSARKPVLKIVELEKCGIVYDSSEPQRIADKLAAMISRPDLLAEMGDRGRRAVLERYNQNCNADILKKVIERCTALD